MQDFVDLRDPWFLYTAAPPEGRGAPQLPNTHDQTAQHERRGHRCPPKTQNAMGSAVGSAAGASPSPCARVSRICRISAPVLPRRS